MRLITKSLQKEARERYPLVPLADDDQRHVVPLLQLGELFPQLRNILRILHQK